MSTAKELGERIKRNWVLSLTARSRMREAEAEALVEELTFPLRELVSLAQPGEGALTGWISVEERLPEPFQEVLVYRPLARETADPLLTIDEYRGGTYRYSPQNVPHGFSRWCHPTHWMPLPPPPGITSTPTGDSNAK